MEYFSDRVMESDNESTLEVPSGYTKYDYQMDAVIEGYQKLLRYDGFFLADVVGLGKTIVATMIAKNSCRRMAVTTPKCLSYTLRQWSRTGKAPSKISA